MNSRLKKKKASNFDKIFLETNIYENMCRNQDTRGSSLGYSDSILVDTSENI
jgi:hypothetical protein